MTKRSGPAIDWRATTKVIATDDAHTTVAQPPVIEHLVAHGRPFVIESDWDVGYFVIVDGERRGWFASFIDAANAVTAPRRAPPATTLCDAAYALELSTFVDFDGAHYHVGVGTSFGQRVGESKAFGGLPAALAWLDGAIARALRSRQPRSDARAVVK